MEDRPTYFKNQPSRIAEDDAEVVRALADSENVLSLSPERKTEVIRILRAALLRQRAEENPR